MNSLSMSRPLNILTLSIGAAMLAATLPAAELKVDLNPPDRRGDVLTPHWENWAWSEGKSGSQTFGAVTVTFRAAPDGVLVPVLFKGLLDYGAHMGCDGIAVGKPAGDGGTDMIVSGLTAGKHTLATYHNEVRDLAPARFDVSVDGTPRIKDFMPTKRATNDYQVAATFLEFDAVAGKDVVIHFVPVKSDANRSLILNGFEIDAVNPHLKAVQPSPANDDEHWPNESALTWTPPATATAHQLYFGTDSNAVMAATPSSPEFKGSLTAADFALPPLGHMKTYFWRVDEINGTNAAPVKGEVWHFRTCFLAFPTAEGYGRFARGGRGGRVIEVTNLEDYNPGKTPIPGSFRAAVEAVGPRTIVFRISGLIKLKAPCAVHNPYCTIAGQTAPGDGICLANFSGGAYGTHDVIIRYMRFRIGDAEHRAMDGAGLGSCDNCIMDHCSISWSSDEGTSSRGAKNITFQRNIVAEALHHGPHYRASDRTKLETHAFAGSISGGIGSYHHNLLADCTDRNWSLAGGLTQGGFYAGYLDIRNNVVYNWTARTTDGGVKELNYVNNYYKPYPTNPFVKWLLKLDPINPAWGTESYYMVGNVMEGFDYESDNWKAFQNGPQVEKQVRVDRPLFPSYVTTQSAREAFTNVLANVGANFPQSDVIDRHLIGEARDGTAHYTGTRGPTYGDRPGPNFAGIIDEPADDKSAAGSPDFPWPEYKTGGVPVDTDHDGIPDDWEKAHGLNPNDPNDANADCNGDGYTNLEKYLNSLVGEYSL
jgi:hypothetical protein